MADNPFQVPTVAEQSAAQSLISVEQQRAVAEVQAQLIIARANPRDPRHAMDLILQDCTRVSLAEGALYEFARGGTEISGPSIRLMETIARRWGNIASAIKEVSRRDGYSECVAYAWDLETNYRDERQFQVRHWRDRRSGGGRLTDERDIYEAIANQGQRRKRAALQAVIPGDVVESAVEQCSQTLRTQADTSPDALKKLVAAFGQFGVTREQIEVRCQRRLDAIRPAQIVQLRRIWSSLRDEMSQPADWFPPAEAGATESQPAPATGNEALRARLAQKPSGTPPAPEDLSPTNTEDSPSAGPAEAPPPSPEPDPPRPSVETPREEGEEHHPAPPEGFVVTVPRRGRGWDWPAYADELLAVANKIERRDELQAFRVANASMLNSLRISNKEEWSRVQQELADIERGDIARVRSDQPERERE